MLVAMSELFSKDMLVELGFQEKGGTDITIHASEILGAMTTYVCTVATWRPIFVGSPIRGCNLYYKPLEIKAVP
jgi:hypothetical protein